MAAEAFPTEALEQNSRHTTQQRQEQQNKKTTVKKLIKVMRADTLHCKVGQEVWVGLRGALEHHSFVTRTQGRAGKGRNQRNTTKNQNLKKKKKEKKKSDPKLNLR